MMVKPLLGEVAEDAAEFQLNPAKGSDKHIISAQLRGLRDAQDTRQANKAVS
jgi:hypothetical protein